MQKLVFPMRESMPHFVCLLRQVDEWKRFQAHNTQVFTQAAYDVNAKYMKSPFAKSLRIEDVLRFLDDTALDMEFMVQLPSIDKCLDQWWNVYAHEDKQVVDADQFRQVYYDLANVLVQAKTENTHKNSVSMIMRASWAKWSVREVPLAQREFYRILFVLAHLMTESSRLGEYVTFFQETLAKITRVVQSKAARSEQRKRKPRMHRKSSFVEIMATSPSGVVGMRTASMSSVRMKNQADNEASTSGEGGAGGGAGGGRGGGGGGEAHGTVNVHVQRVLAVQHSGLGGVDDASTDRFVEVLGRRGIYNQRGTAQHVVVDPLLMERQFQDKWRRPAHANALSTVNALRVLHPVSNKYVPPLTIARLYTSPLSTGVHAGVRGLLLDRHCHSTPALVLKTLSHHGEELDVDAELKAALASRDERDSDDAVLRRSLSAVTLKTRIHENKAQALRPPSKETRKRKNARDQDGEAAAPLYLAIST